MSEPILSRAMFRVLRLLAVGEQLTTGDARKQTLDALERRGLIVWDYGYRLTDAGQDALHYYNITERREGGGS